MKGRPGMRLLAGASDERLVALAHAGDEQAFAAIVDAAFASASTNTARTAPRESASSPRAPDPAYRSSTRAPSSSMRASSMANTDSRTRSDVGLVPAGGAVIGRPRADPAMILMG